MTAAGRGEDRSDIELLRALRSGETGALEALYRRHAGKLASYLGSLLGDPDEAASLTQQTFLSVLEDPGSFKGAGRVLSWLFAVARHLALNELRRRRRHARLAIDAPLSENDTDDHVCLGETLAGSGPSSIDQLLLREDIERVRSALAQLHPALAEILHLRIVSGLSYREIATVTVRPAGTLRMLVHRALVRLRNILEP